MEMTLEQQRAIAMASARVRAAEAGTDDFGSPPPGTIIHGKSADYVAGTDRGDGRPYYAVRPTSSIGTPEGERESAIAGEALRARAAGGDTGALGPVFQGSSLGWGDEAVSGAKAMVDTVAGKSFTDSYALSQEIQRQSLAQERAEHPWRSLAGEVAGSIPTAFATGGFGATARLGQGAGWLPRIGAAAIDGAAYGAVAGAGEGEGALGRLGHAAAGTAIGGGVGALAPVALTIAGAAASPIVRPIMSRIRPDAYADQAMAETLRHSGKSIDDVVEALSLARTDGQDMYTVADALGHAGQRRLAAIARSPHDARQGVVEGLQARQAGQGERLSSYLADAFDAPDTAAARVAALTAARDSAADVSYAAARQGAGPVDVSGALSKLDEVLQPGISRYANPQTQIADDTVEGALVRARRLLTDGRSNLSDFGAVLRAKQDIDDMIGRAVRAGAGNQARLLAIARQELDGALAEASAPYAQARDAFRQGSRVIDAVDTGRAAASGRSRAADNIARFSGLSGDEQSAFRAGYADPLIARVEASAASPTTNKARPLITEKTGREFPAFAAPGKGEQLGDRIAREQRMFETAHAALGGSKTADNIADAASLGGFDGEVANNLLRGRPVAAAMHMIGGAIARGRQGLSPSVTERLSKALLSTDPSAVRDILGPARAAMTRDDIRRAILGMILGQQAADTVIR